MATKTQRAYTAIKIEYVAKSICQLNMTAKKDFVIPGQNGGSVQIRAGEKFTAVRSDSLGENMWYIVRHVSGCKKCSCPAMKPCKHEKAVNLKKPFCPLVKDVVKMDEAETNPLYGVELISPFARSDGKPDIIPATQAQIDEIRLLDKQLGLGQRDLQYHNTVEANCTISSLKQALQKKNWQEAPLGRRNGFNILMPDFVKR